MEEMKDQEIYIYLVFTPLSPFCAWMQLNCPPLVAVGTADSLSGRIELQVTLSSPDVPFFEGLLT